MGFSDKHLNPGEELLLDFKPHWKALVGPVLWTILIALALGASLWIIPNSWLSRLPVMTLILVLVALIAWCVVALPTILAWLAAEYVLTDERLVARTGVVRRSTYDIPVNQINSVTIRQGFFDRILKVGDLVVESASQTGDEMLRSVPRPTDVQNMIARAKDRAGGEVAPGASVTDRLAELDALRASGAVSDEEYSQKRTALLDEL